MLFYALQLRLFKLKLISAQPSAKKIKCTHHKPILLILITTVLNARIIKHFKINF